MNNHYGQQKDLTAYQADSVQFWINEINFQASVWSGDTSDLPYPSSSFVPQLPPPRYAVPNLDQVPSPFPATPYTEPLQETEYSATLQSVMKRPISIGKRETPWMWYLAAGVMFVLLVMSASMAVTVTQTPSVSWTDQVPTTPGTWNVLCPHSVPTSLDPYTIVGPPDLTVDFINHVLSFYHSPAAGTGQALSDAMVRCGIKPGAGLAFFLHESTLGTQGEARSTLSLGNMRCVKAIQIFKCVDEVRGGYAQNPSWEDGYVLWARMMRNQYVDAWEEQTIDEIIPSYAPNRDSNNEAEYIAALKYYLNVWHTGKVAV